MKIRGLIAVLAIGALAAGCSRAAPSHGAAAPAPAPQALTGYLAPPLLLQANRRAAGIRLSGDAVPGAAVRLASPDGSAITGAADRRGVWSLTTPASPSPRLYSLSETVGARLVRAIGYIAVLPAPGPAAAMLRPAAAAVLPPADPQRGIAAIDYDASGAAMASGRTAGGETIRLFLDGKDAGEDRADASGVFSAALSQTLTPAAHLLSVAGERMHASAVFPAPRTTQVATPPYDSARMDGAWRLDWMTPGGGVQSTVLFDERGG
ncbi:MAG TPA: hypothetical protein VIJ94_12665, partial [Caulobacteraceae bacterium]